MLIILGLIFGSFFAALSYRYPRQIPISKGRSFCPKCKKQINWYDNIPLLSFLLLGGKCRDCKKKISIRYPIIELTTAIGFFIIGFNIFNLLIFSILVLIFVIDFEHQIIPDNLVFLGVLVAISNLQSPISNLLAGFTCATLLLLVNLFTKGRGMGLGDVKFAVLGGMLVGLKLSLIWLFLAFLTGAIVGSILILGKKAGLKSQIAFGPFLVASIGLTLLWGEKILELLHLSN
ncbi:MAG TPA: prepilin peptidase [Alphaproteobacteria bacterium]|nr:prepilin peptidase [Alphaproteobacteria bacterium]